MSKMTTEDLRSRLREASSHHIGEEVRHSHVTAIDDALERPVSPTSHRSAWIRRWLTTIATSAAILAPVGVAMAAEPAVPGDVLYPVKLVTESVRSLVDPGIVARHRLTEAEVLRDRGADEVTVTNAVDDAKAAVDESGDDGLRAEMATLVDPGESDVPGAADVDDRDPSGTTGDAETVESRDETAWSGTPDTAEVGESVDSTEEGGTAEPTEEAEVSESGGSDSEISGAGAVSDSESDSEGVAVDD